jgi:hypothetical protein
MLPEQRQFTQLSIWREILNRFSIIAHPAEKHQSRKRNRCHCHRVCSETPDIRVSATLEKIIPNFFVGGTRLLLPGAR